MDQSIGGAEMFLDRQEWPLVQHHHLFPERATHFVCMGKNNFRAKAEVPDLTGIIPRVQTVPIMALMIAMYMGFKTIYLLGTDHDWFVKKEYKYFFDRALQPAKETGMQADGMLTTLLWDELPAMRKIWEQYRAVKHIAAAAGAQIYNATSGGMLDEFDRVLLEDLFQRKS